MKYRNKKVHTPYGDFDSGWEYKRFLQLFAMEQAGTITELSRQVKFELIPAQYAPDTIGPRGGKRKGKLLERNCTYVADFTYKENGDLVVEDAKGFRTKEYIIKRKLMLWVHGIQVKEV